MSYYLKLTEDERLTLVGALDQVIDNCDPDHQDNAEVDDYIRLLHIKLTVACE